MLVNYKYSDRTNQNPDFFDERKLLVCPQSRVKINQKLRMNNIIKSNYKVVIANSRNQTLEHTNITNIPNYLRKLEINANEEGANNEKEFSTTYNFLETSDYFHKEKQKAVTVNGAINSKEISTRYRRNATDNVDNNKVFNAVEIESYEILINLIPTAKDNPRLREYPRLRGYHSKNMPESIEQALVPEEQSMVFNSELTPVNKITPIGQSWQVSSGYQNHSTEKTCLIN